MHRLALAVLVVAVLSSSASAWMRESFPDDEVVQRSELIVVAHIKPGSIVEDPNQGLTQFHATLVIAETMKGHSAATELPIVIHYGLAPDLRQGTRVPIIDTGAVGGLALDDATTDNLWFLRRLSGTYGRDAATTGDLGIVDPQDVRPLSEKAYFGLYLSRDPEAAVRAYAITHVDPRATRYLVHQQVKRVLKVRDPARRVEQLLPYLVHGDDYVTVVAGIVAAGADASGAQLLAMFPTADHSLRETIVDIWGRTRFRGAVDVLVAVLRASDEYWATEHVSAGWWNRDVDSAHTIELRARYGDVYGAAWALGEIGDARAKPAIGATLVRWRTIPFDNPQIVEACEDALRRFAQHK